ncbi:hypothetical protein B0H14DRAFT_3746799 [Mycena olivaceomarginata]|nr:hypothetical protein B0H14DRAFT_3746799 [Mycena olivaceomarginata]
MSFLLSRLRPKHKTKGPSQTHSTVNKLNMVNKAAKLAGGVGEIIPVGGLILKGISTMTSVILETIENNEDLRDIGQRVRVTELLIIELKDLGSNGNQQTALGERYFEACRKFEDRRGVDTGQVTHEMHAKIVADLASNTRGLTPYLRTKDIKNLIDSFKVELDDIKIHWLMKTLAIVHATVSPDDEEDPYYKLKPADIRLEPDTSSVPGFSVATVVYKSGHRCGAEKVLMRRYDSERTSTGRSNCLTLETIQGARNTAAVTQALEHDLAALEKLKNLRFPQIFGICRTSSLKAIVFNEGTNAFMMKEQYQRQSNLTGIDWTLHQLEVDAAVDMVQNHGIVIEPYRGFDAVVRPNGQLVVTGFRGSHGSPRLSWLHDPSLREFRQSFESRSLVPSQWLAFSLVCVRFTQNFESLESLPATTPLFACVSSTSERLLGLACFTNNNPSAQRWLPGFDFQGSHVVQKGIPNVFEWTLDSNVNSHTLTIYVDWTILRMPYKTSSSLLYCAYAPYFNVEWREPRGFSVTISRKHTLAPEKLRLYARPPEVDLQRGTLTWQPLQRMQDDGIFVDLEERDFTFQYEAVYSCRHWDPRGLEALIDLHQRYEVDPFAQGRDIARKIGPKVPIAGFLANELYTRSEIQGNPENGRPDGAEALSAEVLPRS